MKDTAVYTERKNIKLSNIGGMILTHSNDSPIPFIKISIVIIIV